MKLTQNNGKHNISITTGTITALDIMYLFHQITSKAALKKIENVLGKCKRVTFINIHISIQLRWSNRTRVRVLVYEYFLSTRTRVRSKVIVLE